MTDRLNKIFASIKPCKVFADVGCDHGYIAKAMLSSGKCEKVIISDISAKCLKKAEELLEYEIANGRAVSVVSDGFDKIEFCDTALIAGMGGEEICFILKRANRLPNSLVLQPMKNCDKVRICAVNSGYKILSDKIFKSAGKFYDLIVLTKGEDVLTEEEVEFGRDNVIEKGQDFSEMIKGKIEKLGFYLSNPDLSDTARSEMIKEIERLKRYV